MTGYLDDVDGDFAEQEDIAAAVAAGHGYQASRAAAGAGAAQAAQDTAALDRVRALVAEWETYLGGPNAYVNDTAWDVVVDLRAALDGGTP